MHTAIRAIGLIVQVVFFVAVVTFFKMHVGLVLTNSSTLDTLDQQRNPNANATSYDVGAYENFLQVFGTDTAFWLLPIESKSLKGNGVTWQRN